MASATWTVSPRPLSSSRPPKTTSKKASSEAMLSARLSRGTAARPRISTASMKARAMPAESSTPPREVAPLSTSPETTER